MSFTPGTVLNAAQGVLQIFAKDVVAIYDKDYKQLFNHFIFGERVLNPFLSGARPRKAEVILSSKLMSHPLENGATIVDHRVRNLIEIRIPMLINQPTLVDMLLSNESIFSEIKRYYDTSALLIVQTKSGVYKNMVIEEMPEVEESEFFNTLQIELRLKEAPFVGSKNKANTSVPKDSNTDLRGLIQKGKEGAIALAKDVGNKLQPIFNKIGGSFTGGAFSVEQNALPMSASQISKLKEIFPSVNPAGGG